MAVKYKQWKVKINLGLNMLAFRAFLIRLISGIGLSMSNSLDTLVQPSRGSQWMAVWKPLMLRSKCLIFHLRGSCGFGSNFLPALPVLFSLLRCKEKKDKRSRRKGKPAQPYWVLAKVHLSRGQVIKETLWCPSTEKRTHRHQQQ